MFQAVYSFIHYIFLLLGDLEILFFSWNKFVEQNEMKCMTDDNNATDARIIIIYTIEKQDKT